jgi:hypothetical protein
MRRGFFKFKMKNSLLILIAACAVNISAQTSLQIKNNATNAIIRTDSVIPLVSTPNGNTKYTFDIKNNSTTSKVYNVKRYDVKRNVCDPDTALAYFCFGGLCYGADTKISPNTITLGPGKSASDTTAAYYMLIADLDEVCTRGCNFIKYTFFNVNNPADSAQVSLNYNNCQFLVSAVRENVKNVFSLEIFPNPAKESARITINASRVSDASIMLFNSLGEMLSEKNVSVREGKNSYPLDVSALPEGIYFVSIKSANSTTARKLVVY